MSITPIGIASGNGASAATTGAISPHASTQTGDLLIAILALNVLGAPVPAFNLPSGWTRIMPDTVQGTFAAAQASFWRVREVGDSTYELSWANSSVDYAWTIETYRAGNGWPANPIEATAESSYASGQTSPFTVPGITLSANAYEIATISVNSSRALAPDAGNPLSEVTELAVNPRLAYYHALFAAGGATGARSFTISDTSKKFIVRHYGIVEASGAGGGTFELGGAASAGAAIGGGVGLAAVAPVVVLSGAASAGPAAGGGTGLAAPAPLFTLGGSSTATAATGAGAGLTTSSPLATLGGSGSAAAAAGAGPGLQITIPTFTLSGAGSASGALGDGAGLLFLAPGMTTLAGSGGAAAAGGSGVGLAFVAPAAFGPYGAAIGSVAMNDGRLAVDAPFGDLDLAANWGNVILDL